MDYKAIYSRIKAQAARAKLLLHTEAMQVQSQHVEKLLDMMQYCMEKDLEHTLRLTMDALDEVLDEVEENTITIHVEITVIS